MTLPTYHGIGAFGEGLFRESPADVEVDEEEAERLQELYPEVTKELSGFPDNGEV